MLKLPFVLLATLAIFYGARPAAAQTLPTPANRVNLEDFEDGVIDREFNFFVANNYNPNGRYTWSVDSTRGANGTRKSMKLRVTSGTPYFYFDPQAHGGSVRYLCEGKKVNRLAFWLRMPKTWGQGGSPYFNMHIGWYLSNDPTKNETNNGHFYHHLYIVPGSDWIRVVVGANYDWQRNYGTSKFDPAYSLHRLSFSSFFDKVTRFYITGAPNPGLTSWAPVPYDMWIDEIEMYYEPDPVTVSESLIKNRPNVEKTVTVTNASKVSATYAIQVSNYSGTGVIVKNESGAAITSLTIPAGGSRQLRLAPRGLGVSNVVLVKSSDPRNPYVQNRTANAKARLDYDNPATAILVVGQ